MATLIHSLFLDSPLKVNSAKTARNFLKSMNLHAKPQQVQRFTSLLWKNPQIVEISAEYTETLSKSRGFLGEKLHFVVHQKWNIFWVISSAILIFFFTKLGQNYNCLVTIVLLNQKCLIWFPLLRWKQISFERLQNKWIEVLNIYIYISRKW